MEKAFKIPRWHPLYSLYFQYLDNTQEAIQLLVEFRKENKIKCELIQTGVDPKTNEPWIWIGTIKDVKRIRHDKKMLGTALLKPKKNGMYPVRKHSQLWYNWVKKLKEHDDFRVLDEPSTIDYIAISNKKGGGDVGKFEREYLAVGKDLYLRFSSENDFIVNEGLVEIPLYQFYEMKEDKESG